MRANNRTERTPSKLNEDFVRDMQKWTWCKKDKLFDDHYPECHVILLTWSTSKNWPSKKMSAVLTGVLRRSRIWIRSWWKQKLGNEPRRRRRDCGPQENQFRAARGMPDMQRMGPGLWWDSLNTYHHPVCPNHPTNRQQTTLPAQTRE